MVDDDTSPFTALESTTGQRPTHPIGEEPAGPTGGRQDTH